MDQSKIRLVPVSVLRHFGECRIKLNPGIGDIETLIEYCKKLGVRTTDVDDFDRSVVRLSRHATEQHDDMPVPKRMEPRDHTIESLMSFVDRFAGNPPLPCRAVSDVSPLNCGYV